MAGLSEAPAPAEAGEPGGPSGLTTRRVVALAAFAALAAVALYFFLPRLAGLDETWRRIQHGSAGWLVAALGLECVSFAAYVLLFRAVFDEPRAPISWRASYEVSMGGVVATRLFAAGGVGGIAFTAWALRRLGMEVRDLAERLTSFLILLYAVFMASLVVAGTGLYTGLFAGGGSIAITLVPAAFGLGAILLALAMAWTPRDLPRRADGLAGDHRPWLGRFARWLATVPATLGAGVRGAIRMLREHPAPVLAGAVGWWAFDIATLWACFHAFGGGPEIAVIVMSYFLGMIGNLLPLPGGIGGVEGGMIGALIAFGVGGGLAIVAVLAYRGFAFWLPMIPGVIAYLTLRGTIRDGEAAATGSG